MPPTRGSRFLSKAKMADADHLRNSLLRADLLLVIENMLDGPEGEEFPSAENSAFQRFFKINQDGILPADRHVGIAALRSRSPAAG